MGSTHFLIKTLTRVSTEMSLHALAYNLKCVMGVRGIAEPGRASTGFCARPPAVSRTRAEMPG